MSALFEKPFLTDRFDSDSGGRDFLGMQQVNLAMLQDDLIPGLNNRTADFGTFCLGAWIPWKFRKLCGQDARLFVLSKYTAFREAMEVAMAYTARDNSPAEEELERPRTRMGIRHQPILPGPPTFKAAQRKESTSLYAAPLYGPALRYLGLLQATDAPAIDGTSTKIPLAAEDEWTQAIVCQVESSLTASPHFSAVVQLRTPSVSGEALDDLGQHGLHPSFFRQAPAAMKRAFLRKLFAADSGERRHLTAALVCATVAQQDAAAPQILHQLESQGWSKSGSSDVAQIEALRRFWYTNLLDARSVRHLDRPSLGDQCARWAVFQARQIQRTILEVFLRCFELALGAGCRTVDQVISH
jgi:hypothetical protein